MRVGVALVELRTCSLRAWERWASLLKWSAMIAAIFWILVYRLGDQLAQLPDFVYVNF